MTPVTSSIIFRSYFRGIQHSKKSLCRDFEVSTTLRLTLTTISSVLLRNFGHFYQGARCSDDLPPSLLPDVRHVSVQAQLYTFTFIHSVTIRHRRPRPDVCLLRRRPSPSSEQREGRIRTIVHLSKSKFSPDHSSAANSRAATFLSLSVLPSSHTRCGCAA